MSQARRIETLNCRLASKQRCNEKLHRVLVSRPDSVLLQYSQSGFIINMCSQLRFVLSIDTPMCEGYMPCAT